MIKLKVTAHKPLSIEEVDSIVDFCLFNQQEISSVSTTSKISDHVAVDITLTSTDDVVYFLLDHALQDEDKKEKELAITILDGGAGMKLLKSRTQKLVTALKHYRTFVSC